MDAEIVYPGYKEPLKFTLRPYQTQMSDRIIAAFAKAKPFVAQAATGAGKSLIIAELCHRLGVPVLVLQPTKELLEQNYAKLQTYGLDATIYSASMNSKVVGDGIVFATIGSIHKVPHLFAHFQYILVDECDVVNPKAMEGMYQNFFAAIGATNICGLTATPYRMVNTYKWDAGNLYTTAVLKCITSIGKFWTGGLVSKIETAELIDQGYLSPIKYRTDTDDFHELVVNSTGADYTAASLEKWGDRKMLRIADYVQWLDPHCQRNLVFCTSVAQTSRLKDELEARGILSVIVTADTPPRDRAQAVEMFRNGDVKHLLNVGVFLAGFDVPQLDSIVFARPTTSLRVWYQAVGRGVRLDPDRPDKMLRVFDLAGAVHKMGRVETIRLGKEADGHHDLVSSEIGRMDNRTLFSFKVRRKGAYR
jgi:DNA repair protein RadD